MNTDTVSLLESTETESFLQMADENVLFKNRTLISTYKSRNPHSFNDRVGNVQMMNAYCAHDRTKTGRFTDREM